MSDTQKELPRSSRLVLASMAVINAAKAWHNPTLNNNDRYRAEDALHRAVAKLIELENAR